MGEHSRLAPSSAYQWIFCPASVVLQEQHPENKDSQDALDGETAHELGRNMLDTEGKAPLVAPSQVTDEISRAVDTYVQAVRSVAGTSKVTTEKRIQIPLVHSTCFGTFDAEWYDKPNCALHIWDLKFGWGIVDAFVNWQLLLYAMGEREEYISSFYLHIVQPRAPHPEGPVRTWGVSYADVMDTYAPRASKAAALALGPSPPTVTGQHCRYCSALYACPAAEQAVLNAIDVSGRAQAPTPAPEQIGFELSVLRRANDMIKHRLTATEQTALALSKKGTVIPGWTQGFTAGKKVWSGKPDEIRAAAEMYGVTVDKPADLITPVQAVNAGIPEDIVAMYSEKRSGKARMEPINQDKVKQILG